MKVQAEISGRYFSQYTLKLRVLTFPKPNKKYIYGHKHWKKCSTIFCSPFRQESWYDQLGGVNSTIADAFFDRILHDAYKINIESIDPSFHLHLSNK